MSQYSIWENNSIWKDTSSCSWENVWEFSWAMILRAVTACVCSGFCPPVSRGFDLIVVLFLPSLRGCHGAEVSGRAGTAPQNILCFWARWVGRRGVVGCCLCFPWRKFSLGNYIQKWVGVVKSSAQELGNARVMFPVLSSLFVSFLCSRYDATFGHSNCFYRFVIEVLLKFFSSDN